MAGDPNRRPFWLRLPRWTYWLSGAVIALAGGYIARGLSEQVPVDHRLPYWFGGSVFIFLGLYVLSLGTKSRLDQRDRKR